MQPIAKDFTCSMVCLFGTWVNCAKMAEPIEMPSDGQTLRLKELQVAVSAGTAITMLVTSMKLLNIEPGYY